MIHIKRNKSLVSRHNLRDSGGRRAPRETGNRAGLSFRLSGRCQSARGAALSLCAPRTEARTVSDERPSHSPRLVSSSRPCACTCCDWAMSHARNDVRCPRDGRRHAYASLPPPPPSLSLLAPGRCRRRNAPDWHPSPTGALRTPAPAPLSVRSLARCGGNAHRASKQAGAGGHKRANSLGAGAVSYCRARWQAAQRDPRPPPPPPPP